MVREVCPIHAFDDYEGVWVGSDVGYLFTCPLDGHSTPGPLSWLRPPEPDSLDAFTGLATELQLERYLPAALEHHRGTWVEYGILEHDYAVAHPAGWELLMERYSHTAVQAKRYTATSFLAGVVGRLYRRGIIAEHNGPATGRWSYNRISGYLALPPDPEWNNRLSWEDSGLTVAYVPGQTEP